MKIKRLMSLSALAAAALLSLPTSAANLNVTAARSAAGNFLKQQALARPGTINAPALADLKLAHAEPSGKVKDANDFYAFNIKGGGFVIVAGEDRATPVLGYSDKGKIDFNNLPPALQDLLEGYKREIEFLQTYTGNDLKMVTPELSATSVDPLIKTTWGQEMPYYLQCPIYRNEYCVVGCVATAMAQVMNYWQYPTSCGALDSYYCYDIRQTVQGLPATTFDYSLMLPSYCHWDYDNGVLVQDTYTDAQAQEVAKISRYCGQAVEMGYSPDGSGAYTSDQLAAMKWFGYSSNAQDVSKGGGIWNWGNNYTDSQWETMMKNELNAGRPLLYSATDPSSGGHAFICDGYNTSNYFHFNYGWYGTCDGWYVSTSLRMTHRDGDQLNFSSNHEMLTGMEPPTYCIINNVVLEADNELLVLGESLNARAVDFTFRTSYNSFNLLFGLVDADGNRVCTSDAVNVDKNSFVQGSTVNGSITLPATLETGTYNLGLGYYTTNANNLTNIANASGQLTVVGKIAKYGQPFTPTDVTTVINYLLGNDYPQLTVSDATQLINYVLNSAE